MDWEKKLNLTAKYMMIGVGICFLFFLALGLLVIKFFYPFEGMMPYSLGLLASTGFSFLRIIMMRSSVKKAADKEAKSAKGSFQLGFALRQVLTLVFLGAAVLLNKYIGLVGILVGMFFVKISGYISNSLLKKWEKKNSVGLEAEVAVEAEIKTAVETELE